MSEHSHAHEHHHSHDHAHNHENFEATKGEELTKILISAFFLALGFIFDDVLKVNEYLSLVCFGISYVAVGFGVIKNAVEDILSKNIFNECLMITIASVGALIIKEYDEGCAVMLLYAVGEFIHGLALSKSKKAIRTHEKSEAGHNHINEGGETESFIAKFAKFYTPVICLLAALVILIPPLFLGREWKEWLYRGFSVLVIGCPCAIVISVPLSFSCAIDSCTRKGVYIYHSHALESLYKTGSTQGVIAKDDEGIAFAKKAAKKAVFIARENVYIALLIKAVVFVLAVFLEKELPMWVAAFSDVGIAGLAVLNSLRTLRIK